MSVSKCYVEINVSRSNSEAEDELIKIKFKNNDFLQINFSKFFIQSKFIQDKYKYSEALNFIQSEIEEIETKINIKDESIKYFIQLVQDEKVNIPIDHFKDIYTLSEYFCIPKFTTVLNNIIRKELFRDLDFTIQILVDSEAANESLETKFLNEIENFLTVRINDCIKNAKFGELQVSTICRILDQSKGEIDPNLLVDFIFESVQTRFVLFKFVEISKLVDYKIEEFIKFIEEQNEDSRKMYLEYIQFDFSFIKNIINKYDKLFSDMNQMKQELSQAKQESGQAKQELSQTKQELSQAKQELSQTKQEHMECKRELKQTKDDFNQLKNDQKQCPQSVIVSGLNEYNGLGEKSNNKNEVGTPIISPPIKLSLDLSSLLSYSIYCNHTVLVMNDGSLKGIGRNTDGRVSATLQKRDFDDFTDFSIRDASGHQLTAISAVCCQYGTLYMFSKSSGIGRHLVLCDKDINKGSPVFLDINNHHPVSLFGGSDHSAAIGSEGEVIFINHNLVKKSPNSPIEAVFLPDGEKALSICCCIESVFVLSTSGRIFQSLVHSNNVLKFSAVDELSGQEFVCVSGTYNHCLAVSKEGLVFGYGSNEFGKLGLGKGRESASSFTKIQSLVGYKIRAACAGRAHSLFETQEGKILSCGRNYFGQLLLSSVSGENVYLPTETIINSGATFCIAGNAISIVFIGNMPSAKMPNMRIQQYH